MFRRWTETSSSLTAEHLPFLEGELAPHHLVARLGVAVELDAVDQELLAGIDIKRDVHRLVLSACGV